MKTLSNKKVVKEVGYGQEELSPCDKAYVGRLTPWELNLLSEGFPLGDYLEKKINKKLVDFVDDSQKTRSVLSQYNGDASYFDEIILFAKEVTNRPCSLVRKVAAFKEFIAGDRLDLMLAIESLSFYQRHTLKDEDAKSANKAIKALKGVCSYFDDVSKNVVEHINVIFKTMAVRPKTPDEIMFETDSLTFNMLNNNGLEKDLDSLELFYLLSTSELVSMKEDDETSVMFKLGEEHTYPKINQLVITSHLPATPIIYDRDSGYWCRQVVSPETDTIFTNEPLEEMVMFGALSWREIRYNY